VLLTAFLAHYSDGSWPREGNVVWQGADGELSAGQAVKDGSSLVIYALSPSGRAQIVFPRTPISAGPHPVFRWSAESLSQRVQIYLSWQTAGDGARPHTLPLVGQNGTVYLRGSEGWRDTVVRVWLTVTGRLQAPLTLHQIAFTPASRGALLAAAWSEWTAFRGWTQSSINFFDDSPRRALVRATPAVAAWVGLALLLYGAWTVLWRREWDWGVGGLVFLLAWLTLDARWQWWLWRQMGETYQQYAGKASEEKQLAADDGELYAVLQQVETQLPRTPQRIFLVAPSAGTLGKYLRLRAEYHLLPHNVCNCAETQPKPHEVRAGDYILVLGSEPSLEYIPSQGVLRTRTGLISVERVATYGYVTLYRVT
jgi:hypothetical protein